MRRMKDGEEDQGPLPNSVGGPTHIQLRDDRSWDDEDIIEEMDTTLDTRRLSAMIPISSGGEERVDQVEFREGQITLNKAQRPRRPRRLVPRPHHHKVA